VHLYFFLILDIKTYLEIIALPARGEIEYRREDETKKDAQPVKPTCAVIVLIC